MKIFAFIPTQSIQKTYTGLILKYKKKESLIDILKTSVLIVFIVVCIFIYLYFVNLSSTRGYFLRKENQNFNNVAFLYEIEKTKFLEQKQKNREAINQSSSQRKIIVLPIGEAQKQISIQQTGLQNTGLQNTGVQNTGTNTLTGN